MTNFMPELGEGAGRKQWLGKQSLALTLERAPHPQS